MNPYQKGAKLLLRVIATGMILVGGMNAALELLRRRAHPAEFSLWQVVLGSAGFLAGVVLLLVSSKIAARWTQDFDE